MKLQRSAQRPATVTSLPLRLPLRVHMQLQPCPQQGQEVPQGRRWWYGGPLLGRDVLAHGVAAAAADYAVDGYAAAGTL